MVLPILSIIGLGLQAAGTVGGFVANRRRTKAAEANEEIRQEQLELDVQRAQRENIRQAILARSTALTNATAQGAQYGTGLQGGYGQIQGATLRNERGLRENKELGIGIFENNATQSKAAGAAGFFGGLSTLGGGLIQNQGTISQIGEFFQGRNNS